MAVDLSMIPQVSAPSLSADFFREMANARQTAFNGLMSPIQATSKAFVDNRTQQAQELIRQAQSVGDMQSPDLQAGIQSIIDRSGGFVDQNAINQAQQVHLAQLYGNQQTYALSDSLDKAKTQEQVNLLVQQKIAQRDFEGARELAQSSVTSAGLANLGSAVTSAENAPLDRQLDVLSKLSGLNHTATVDANQTNQVATQMLKLADELEAQAIALESRTTTDALGRTVRDPAGAAQAATLRAQAAQYRSQIQTSSPQQVLSAVGGAADTMNGNPLQGGDVNSFVEKLVNVESGGDPTAKNPKSTATGAGQFIESTWLTMMKNYRPDLAGKVDPNNPKSPEAVRVLAMRNDPALSREMTLRYAEENGERLTKAGFPVNEGTLYTLHFLGEDGGIKALQAYQSNPNTSAESILGSEVVNANPKIMKGKTIKDVVDYSLSVMGNPKRNGGVSAASALASNYQATTPSPVQAAGVVTSVASQGASSPTATAATMNLQSIPAEMQEKYKPYTDSKGNFLPIKFGNGKSIDTLDASIEALIAKGQAEIDQAYQDSEAKRDLQGIDKDVAGYWLNLLGSTKDKINLYNLIKEMPIYQSSKGDRPILTDTELNEVIQSTAADLDSNGKWDNDEVRLSTLQRMLSNAVGRKADKVYKKRNKIVGDGLAGLAKEYGTTVAVLEQVLKNRGNTARYKTGANAFIDTTDITPRSKNAQSTPT